MRIIDQRFEEIKTCIAVQSKIYSHRCFNYIVGHYRHHVDSINPYMILRFDCRQINDLVTLRVGPDRKEHWIIAACNDGYLRVFSLKNLQLHKVVKGLSGNPICIDVANTNGADRQAVDMEAHRDLLAVGYQDNSFVVFSILQGFKPLYRGHEHRSFVCQVKFDNAFMRRQLELREEERKGGSLEDPDEGNLPDSGRDGPELAQKIAGKTTGPGAAGASGIALEEQKMSDVMVQKQRSRRMGSKNRLVDFLRRTTTMNMHQSHADEREYRLVTTGEDGMVFFWSAMAKFTASLDALE